METVLITGGSRGIGADTARLFAQAGYQVVINYFNSEAKAQGLVAELTAQGLCAWAIRADVGDHLAVKKMFEAIEARFGGVDILVNNAGIAQQKLFTEITLDDWQQMFNVTVNGAFHCAQGALPYMIGQKRGKIINISSIWGMVGASCEVHYSAAKAALLGFTKALAKELGPSHIQVNCVAPGVVATEMNQNLDSETIEWLQEETPLGVIGTPRDIGAMILFLASAQGDFITGQVISPNGGFVIV